MGGGGDTLGAGGSTGGSRGGTKIPTMTILYKRKQCSIVFSYNVVTHQEVSLRQAGVVWGVEGCPGGMD